MKRFITIALCFTFVACILTGCGRREDNKTTDTMTTPSTLPTITTNSPIVQANPTTNSVPQEAPTTSSNPNTSDNSSSYRHERGISHFPSSPSGIH